MEEVLLRVGEDRAALLRLLPELLQLPPEDPAEQDDQEAAAGQDQDRPQRVLGDVAEALGERAGHGEEEVEVDERARDREEDLLHEVGGERAGEGRGRDDRGEHDQRRERADVRGQEVVHRDADGVGGHDRPELDLARIGRAQDPVVRKPRQERLSGLEEERRDDVAGRNVLDLVPEVLQPADDVDPEEVEDEDDDDGADDPAGDLDQPAPPGRIVERGDVRDGLAHRRAWGVEIEVGMSAVALIASVS